MSWWKFFTKEVEVVREVEKPVPKKELLRRACYQLADLLGYCDDDEHPDFYSEVVIDSQSRVVVKMTTGQVLYYDTVDDFVLDHFSD